MKKINIDGVIIVEGKADVSFLSNYLDALFFITNGYDLNQEKVDFLNRVSKVNKLLILTDPDKAGEDIRNTIKNKIHAGYDVLIPLKQRKRYQKTGVAESEIEVIINALKPYIKEEENKYIDYELNKYISLSDNPKDTREYIVKKYGLIYGNNKSLNNQLNMLKIKKEELWK